MNKKVLPKELKEVKSNSVGTERETKLFQNKLEGAKNH